MSSSLQVMSGIATMDRIPLSSPTSTLKMLHHVTHVNLISRPRLSACRKPLKPVFIACSDKVKVEPITNAKFPTSLVAPGGSSTLSLVGTGYREKNIAFIKVKVYAIGVYVDAGVTTSLAMWKGRSEEQLCKDPSFFKAVIEATMEKAIKIVLVRDVDGATFWAALDEAVAPRLKASNAGVAGQEALDAFGEVFKGRSLKQGTSIYLTWVQPFKLQVAVSGDSMVPESVEASIVSADLVSSLFDVYLGENPVSPSTKASVASELKVSL
ncbi:hypothetical protein L7F22_050488 [Adiantum nelumboides]|nr:hypothetical protein [Adiantum nelumboides]